MGMIFFSAVHFFTKVEVRSDRVFKELRQEIAAKHDDERCRKIKNRSRGTLLP